MLFCCCCCFINMTGKPHKALGLLLSSIKLLVWHLVNHHLSPDSHAWFGNYHSQSLILNKRFGYGPFVLKCLRVSVYTDLSIWPQGWEGSASMFCLWYICSHKQLHAHCKVYSAADVSRNAMLLCGLSDNYDHIFSTTQNEYKTAFFFFFLNIYILTFHCCKRMLNFQQKLECYLMIPWYSAKRDGV